MLKEKKIISPDEAAALIDDGCRLMVGGFLKCGSPKKVINELVKRKTGNLTLIANDTSFCDSDKGLLIANHLVSKAIVTHIGMNPETGNQMHTGALAVELVPQGTLAERIRAGGAGLGGVLTPTGLGTQVEEGKQKITVADKVYLLETALTADVALIYASKADKYGNLSFEGTTRNFNTVMATAAQTVIVEVDAFVDCLLPNEIVVPGLLVDYLVFGGDKSNA